MYSDKTDFLMTFLLDKENSHRRASAELATDSRADEANFEKIRANVFGIFRAVLETAVKIKGECPEALEFFSAKLREIPASWRGALEKAKNSESAYVEKLKLDSVKEIERFIGDIK